MIYQCSNPAAWHKSVKLHRIELHHNPPKSWTTDDGASSTKIPLCGTDHNEVHALLDLYVHANGPPPWVQQREFGVYIRNLAAAAWAKRIPGQTPYTVAHP